MLVPWVPLDSNIFADHIYFLIGPGHKELQSLRLFLLFQIILDLVELASRIKSAPLFIADV